MLHSVLEYIEKHFPTSFPAIRDGQLINPHLFSKHQVQLPESVLNTAGDVVASIDRIKEQEEYQQKLPEYEKLKAWPSTPSILSCMDFHYSETMGLKLIEINTNASLYIPFKIQKQILENPSKSLDLTALYRMFDDTFNFQSNTGLSIFDRSPRKEGLYFEFLIIKEWLETQGVQTNIVSLESFKKESKTSVYNRFTDFYFKEPGSDFLLKDYLKGLKVFSPNPREYSLTADKKRLQLLRETLTAESQELGSVIPESRQFSEFNDYEEIWKNRKKYFFKPSQSFGSKGVFSGKSISRKAFENICSPAFMAQELCPAGKRTFTVDGKDQEFKFDLRIFYYKGKILNYGARVYQGQATNMRTPGGGLAAVEFI